MNCKSIPAICLGMLGSAITVISITFSVFACLKDRKRDSDSSSEEFSSPFVTKKLDVVAGTNEQNPVKETHDKDDRDASTNMDVSEDITEKTFTDKSKFVAGSSGSQARMKLGGLGSELRFMPQSVSLSPDDESESMEESLPVGSLLCTADDASESEGSSSISEDISRDATTLVMADYGLDVNRDEHIVDCTNAEDGETDVITVTLARPHTELKYKFKLPKDATIYNLKEFFVNSVMQDDGLRKEFGIANSEKDQIKQWLGNKIEINCGVSFVFAGKKLKPTTKLEPLHLDENDVLVLFLSFKQEIFLETAKALKISPLMDEDSEYEYEYEEGEEDVTES